MKDAPFWRPTEANPKHVGRSTWLTPVCAFLYVQDVIRRQELRLKDIHAEINDLEHRRAQVNAASAKNQEAAESLRRELSKSKKKVITDFQHSTSVKLRVQKSRDFAFGCLKMFAFVTATIPRLAARRGTLLLRGCMFETISVGSKYCCRCSSQS